jgi:hypothetical protein
MSEMVEKVSAAIAEAQARGFNGPEVLARVAITALREPTQAMGDAVTGGDQYSWPNPDETWRAMIDEALR